MKNIYLLLSRSCVFVLTKHRFQTHSHVAYKRLDSSGLQIFNHNFLTHSFKREILCCTKRICEKNPRLNKYLKSNIVGATQRGNLDGDIEALPKMFYSSIFDETNPTMKEIDSTNLSDRS